MNLESKVLHLTNRKAFTLIELMISIIVFSLFLGIVISSFLHFTRTYAENNERRKVYIEARQVLDTMVQEFRLGRIDYDCYYYLPAPDQYCNDSDVKITTQGVTETLVILKNNGLSRVIYDLDNSQVRVVKQKRSDNQSQSWVAEDGYSSWVPILSDRISVQRLAFRVWPKDDPYRSYADNPTVVEDLSSIFQYQPKLSVFLTLQTKSRIGPTEYDLVNLQTTVSSRFYNRL